MPALPPKPANSTKKRRQAVEQHHIKPYAVRIEAAPRGIVIVADAEGPDGVVRSYKLHLQWNGWVSHLLKAMADVVAAKVDLTK